MSGIEIDQNEILNAYELKDVLLQALQGQDYEESRPLIEALDWDTWPVVSENGCLTGKHANGNDFQPQDRYALVNCGEDGIVDVGDNCTDALIDLNELTPVADSNGKDANRYGKQRVYSISDLYYYYDDETITGDGKRITTMEDLEAIVTPWGYELADIVQ